jgi:fluoroacetyl-CoA thioesterase
MNTETVSQLFFDERYTVPPEQTAHQVFRAIRTWHDCAGTLVDAMATTSVLTVLECACLRELHACIDDDREALVGVAMQCRHRGAIPAGAALRITGWVERLGEREVTFRVQAHDEQEEVFEGSIRIAVVPRDRIAAIIERKRGAIARRTLVERACRDAA